MKDPNFKNLLKLAIAFQLILGAYYTIAAIQKVILQSAKAEDPSFDSDGFICLGLIHVFYGLSNFIAPTIVTAAGVKTTLIITSIFHGSFIPAFFYPKAWVIYTICSLMGLTAGWLWVANGVYFSKCSTEKTANKNMGIYWTIQASGQVIGLAFIFWRFQGVTHINPEMRFWVITALTAVSGLGTVILCFLDTPSPTTTSTVDKPKKDIKNGNGNATILETMSASFRLLSNKNILLLLPTCVYAGFEGAFYSGIYPTAVGFTEGFGSDAKKYMGLIGILIGLGIMTGGVVFGIIGSKLFKSSSRTVNILVAGLCHSTAISLIYANLADSSTFGDTSEESLMNPPSVMIAMLCGFLLGVGDGCLMPQIIAAVGVIWSDDPTAAYALFRFFQGNTAGIVFVVSTMTGLHNLLYVFLGILVVGTFTFCWNENLIKKENKDSKDKVGSTVDKAFHLQY